MYSVLGLGLGQVAMVLSADLLRSRLRLAKDETAEESPARRAVADGDDDSDDAYDAYEYVY